MEKGRLSNWDRLSLTAEEAATYYIVLKGSRARGKCFVDWQIN